MAPQAVIRGCLFELRRRATLVSASGRPTPNGPVRGAAALRADPDAARLIGLDSTLPELGFDLLTLVDVIVAIEQRFGFGEFPPRSGRTTKRKSRGPASPCARWQTPARGSSPRRVRRSHVRWRRRSRVSRDARCGASTSARRASNGSSTRTSTGTHSRWAAWLRERKRRWPAYTARSSTGN